MTNVYITNIYNTIIAIRCICILYIYITSYICILYTLIIRIFVIIRIFIIIYFIHTHFMIENYNMMMLVVIS